MNPQPARWRSDTLGQSLQIDDARPNVGFSSNALTAEASMGCLPNEAVKKSVNGGSRRDPCRCRFTDHSQPLDETDKYSGGT